MISTLREMRRSIDVSQKEFARLLDAPLETLRTWDSGRRPAPPDGAAVLAYQQRFHRRSYSRTMRKPPIPRGIDLPVDYAERVTLTRHALRLTLSEFAARIGAANKAVVYQWESGKRRPSPVFWARIVALRRGR